MSTITIYRDVEGELVGELAGVRQEFDEDVLAWSDSVLLDSDICCTDHGRHGRAEHSKACCECREELRDMDNEVDIPKYDRGAF